MMDVAGTDKNCVEVVPMLLKKSEIGTDAVDFGKWEECVQTSADQNKGERGDPDIQESPAGGKLGAPPVDLRQERLDFRHRLHSAIPRVTQCHQVRPFFYPN